jgi:hypothetical protein
MKEGSLTRVVVEIFGKVIDVDDFHVLVLKLDVVENIMETLFVS